MELLVTQNGRNLIASALNSGNSLPLIKIYLLDAVFEPSGSELPLAANIVREEVFNASVDDNVLSAELNIAGSTISSDVIIKSICVSCTYNNTEQNFAVANNSSGLFELKEGVSIVISILLSILGSSSSAITVNNNIQYPLASTSNQGTVMLANDSDIVGKNATRDNKPLVVSPAQLNGPYIVDYWFGAISFSQDSANNITASILQGMDSTTATVTLDNTVGHVDFVSTNQVPEGWHYFLECTFTSGNGNYIDLLEDPSVFYEDLRGNGLPASGEGSVTYNVKIVKYAFPAVVQPQPQ